MAERRKLDLSFSQVAAGALATVTATILASFLGTFGTIIGAAASSVVSTAGYAIYQHFFVRTGDKLKEAGQHVVAKGALRTALVSPHGTGMSTVKVPGRAAKPRSGGPESAQPRPESRPETRSATRAETRSGTRPGTSATDRPTSGKPASEATRSQRRGPRTLADIVDRPGEVTSRVADGRSNGASREPSAGAFPIATGETPAEPPESGSQDGSPADSAVGGGRGAFGDRPDDGGTAKMGAFGDGERDGDATRVDAAGAGDDADDGANGAGETTAIGGPDGAEGADDGADETSVIGEDSNLADSEDAETMAISAMSGVSEVYTASTVRPRASLGEMLSWARGRWAVLLGGAVVVFAVVMGGVTLAEKIMDKPLSDAVRGRGGSGLTLTGGSGGTTPTPAPTDSPTTTGTPNPTGTTRPTPGNTAQNTPNPAQTNPQPGQTSHQPLRPTTNPSSVPSSQPSSTGGRNGTTNNDAQPPTQAPTGQ